MITQSRILVLAYLRAYTEWNIALELASDGDKEAMKQEEKLYKEIMEILELLSKESEV